MRFIIFMHEEKIHSSFSLTFFFFFSYNSMHIEEDKKGECFDKKVKTIFEELKEILPG